MRDKALKIGVLVTDGKSQDDIIVNSQKLREQGIELYAIGEFTTPKFDGQILGQIQPPLRNDYAVQYLDTWVPLFLSAGR